MMAGNVSKTTVLLVDDEPSIRRFIAAALTQHGYTVLDAGSGEEGLALFRNNHLQIRLVVTDIIMPEMSGFDLADAIEAESPETPILYISGYDAELREPGHANKILRKPFRVAEFVQTVEQMIKPSE